MASRASGHTGQGFIKGALVVALGLALAAAAPGPAKAQEEGSEPGTLSYTPSDAWGVLQVDVQAIMRGPEVQEALDKVRPRGAELRPEIRAIEEFTAYLLPTSPPRYLKGPLRWGAVVDLTPEGTALLTELAEGMEEFRLGELTGHQWPGLAMALVRERTLAIASDRTALESVIEAGPATEKRLQTGLSELRDGYSEGMVCGAFLLPGPLGTLAEESDLEGASPWVHSVRGGAFCFEIGQGLTFRSVTLLGSRDDAEGLRGELDRAIEWLKPDLEAALTSMWEELAWPLLAALEGVEARVDEGRFIAELRMAPGTFSHGDDLPSAAAVASYLLRQMLFRRTGPAAAPGRPLPAGRPAQEPKRRPAARPEGTWDGFRGIQWGESLAGREDMMRVAEDETGMMVEYRREGDSMSVGDSKLNRLSYFACEDKFCRVTGDVDGAEGIRALRLALEAEYGVRPALGDDRSDARTWYGSTLRCALLLGYPLKRCSVRMDLGVSTYTDWQLAHEPLVRGYRRDRDAGRRDPAAERARVERLIGEQGRKPIQPVPAAPRGWKAETRQVTVASAEGDDAAEIVYYTSPLGMELVPVPPGEFTMGSSPRQSGHTRSQGPLHRVRVTKGFYMGAHEVTQRQYEAVVGSTPSEFPGERRPVEMVTWHDALAFCRKLSDREGVTYRLPTEAEWEYACRAGSTSPYHFAEGLGERFREVRDEYIRRRGERPARTHDVGLMPPNAWGLYGMSWNVREWCQDWYGEHYYWKSPLDDPSGPESGESRVLRGGSPGDAFRWASAAREGYTPTVRRNYVGFRVLCTGQPHRPRGQTAGPKSGG